MEEKNNKRFAIRLTETQRESYGLAAARKGVGISKWIRKVLDRAARNTRVKEGGK